MLSRSLDAFSRRLCMSLAFACACLGAEAQTPNTTPTASVSDCTLPSALDHRFTLPTRQFDIPSKVLRADSGSVPLTPPGAGFTFKIVVFGDSAIWGDGLTNKEKIVYKVGETIANRTGKQVHIDTFAHSGARLSQCDNDALLPLNSDDTTAPGDLDSQLPDVWQQADFAATANNDRDADLVLVDGCINEIHATDIALPFMFDRVTSAEISKRVHSFCSDRMAATLDHVQNAFPHATVLLMGYWRVVSPDSRTWGVMMAGGASAADQPSPTASQRRQMKKLFRTADRLETASQHPVLTATSAQPGPPKQQSETVRWQHWYENSTAFLDTSRECMRWAVAKVNQQVKDSSTQGDTSCSTVTSAPVSSPRVYFVPGFDKSEYSYGARDKHVWSLPVRFIFWVRHPDDMYRDRASLCKSHFRGKENRMTRFKCGINPLAHPNVEGARFYHDAMISVLERAWATPRP
ncbi:MAG TPA: hypothetical protein VGR96_06170 [Acidobacteriaceae bacterium]|nr:hypothetical protein [Acidobacteriaceae bacterium]